MTRLLELDESPNVGGSENTKALIGGVGFRRGQKSFQGETPKIPQSVPDPNKYMGPPNNSLVRPRQAPH